MNIIKKYFLLFSISTIISTSLMFSNFFEPAEADNQLFDTFSVPGDGSVVTSNKVLTNGEIYQITASGQIKIGGPGYGDAEFGYSVKFDSIEPGGHASYSGIINNCFNSPDDVDLGIGIDNTTNGKLKIPNWGTFTETHSYTINFTGKGSTISLNYHDCDYSDNSNDNEFTVQIYGPSTPPPNLTTVADIKIPKGSSSPPCDDTKPCYNPSSVTTTPRTIIWGNEDTAAHTVTSGKPGEDQMGTVFESGLFTPGKTWSHTFSEPGYYPYFCSVHPWMVGAITIIPPTPVCGNKILETGEQCDPPNTGTCDSFCQTIIPICGDGRVNQPNEKCEPPNTATCDSFCQTIIKCGPGMVLENNTCVFVPPLSPWWAYMIIIIIVVGGGVYVYKFLGVHIEFKGGLE